MPNSINNLTLKSLNLLEYYQQDRNNCGTKLSLNSFEKTNEKDLLAILGGILLLTYSLVHSLIYSFTLLLTHSFTSIHSHSILSLTLTHSLFAYCRSFLDYFLRIINGEEYISRMNGIWPYQDVKMKNNSKRIISEYLHRLVEDKRLRLSDMHASILSLAKGDKVWKLLYKLSEHCVSICINHYNTSVALRNSSQHLGIRLTYPLTLTHSLTHSLI